MWLLFGNECGHANSSRSLQWANQLSSESRVIYDKEVCKRKRFNQQLSLHFLHRLFPSLNDLPPPFATEKPEDFDEELPQVSRLLKGLPVLKGNSRSGV